MSDNNQVEPMETINEENELEEVVGKVGVSDSPEEQSSSGNDAGATFTAIKGVIQNLSVKLDELKEKQSEYKQRLKNLMENDSQLSAYEEQAKEAAIAFKKRKKELYDSIEGKEAQARMKETGEEVKDIEESLTNHLLNYYQMTGAKSFETPSGEEREFSLKARLMPNKKQ